MYTITIHWQTTPDINSGDVHYNQCSTDLAIVYGKSSIRASSHSCHWIFAAEAESKVPTPNRWAPPSRGATNFKFCLCVISHNHVWNINFGDSRSHSFRDIRHGNLLIFEWIFKISIFWVSSQRRFFLLCGCHSSHMGGPKNFLFCMWTKHWKGYSVMMPDLPQCRQILLAASLNESFGTEEKEVWLWKISFCFRSILGLALGDVKPFKISTF